MTRKCPRRSNGKAHPPSAAAASGTDQQPEAQDNAARERESPQNEARREGEAGSAGDDTSSPALQARTLGTAAYKKGNYQQAFDVRPNFIQSKHIFTDLLLHIVRRNKA
jgi:hypothetical protein